MKLAQLLFVFCWVAVFTLEPIGGVRRGSGGIGGWRFSWPWRKSNQGAAQPMRPNHQPPPPRYNPQAPPPIYNPQQGYRPQGPRPAPQRPNQKPPPQQFVRPEYSPTCSTHCHENGSGGNGCNKCCTELRKGFTGGNCQPMQYSKSICICT